MKHTISFNQEQDTIYIPTSIYQHDTIELKYSDETTNLDYIDETINYVKSLPTNAKIYVNCKMLKHIEHILPKIDGLTIRLHSSNDLEQFLKMNNQLNSHDTKNKQLTIYTPSHINIDGCKPTDLPLKWHIIVNDNK